MTSAKRAKAVWPGANVEFVVHLVPTTNRYAVLGRAGPDLINRLAEVGITVTRQDVQEWCRVNGPSLDFK